jgi:acyl dehydratase
MLVVAVDEEHAATFAEATCDNNPLYYEGKCVPPFAFVASTWPALVLAFGEIGGSQAEMGAVFHYAHDVHLARPIAPREPLEVAASLVAARAGSFGRLVTFRIEATNEASDLVVDQYASLFVRGAHNPERRGANPPEHRRHSVDDQPVAKLRVPIAADQAGRFAIASGDRAPIHVDDDAARSAGLGGVILHGMCAMAISLGAMVDALAGGDMRRVRRFATRFAKPVYPPTVLNLDVRGLTRDADHEALGFSVTSADALVMRDGCLVLSCARSRH